jgi:hypothetical protein
MKLIIQQEKKAIQNREYNNIKFLINHSMIE